MKRTEYYEQYPMWMIIVCNLLSIAIYAIGVYIMVQVGLVWVLGYLLLILWLEYSVLRSSCAYCYYYGKACAFGKGKICSLFFKRGNPKKFIKRELTWKSLIPDLMVSLIPLLAGILLLIINFNLPILLMVILLIVLTSVGNGIVRGSFACKYCKQRRIGCPAERLFSKKQ